jgi:uncharacterized protein involved in exopolysaccharide biosynthesis
MFRLILLKFLESYFRHRWLYLLPFVMMVGIGAAYILTSTPKYVARGIIFVQTESFLASLNSVRNNNASWWTTPAQVINNEINELLRTEAFIRAIIFRSDLEVEMNQEPEAIAEFMTETRKSVWITPIGDNQVQVNASHSNPLVAYQLVNSVIENYIQWQVNMQRTESESAQVFFTDQVRTYEEDLLKARNELIEFLIANPEPLHGSRSEIEMIEIDRYQKAIDIAEARYVSALDKEENARLAVAQVDSDTRQSFTMIDSPVIPDKPEVSRKQLAIQAAVFVSVGLIISVVAIAGGALLDRSIRLPVDLHLRTHLPILAVVPDMTVREKWYRRLLPKRNPAIKRIKRQIEEPSEPDLPELEPGVAENPEMEPEALPVPNLEVEADVKI